LTPAPPANLTGEVLGRGALRDTGLDSWGDSSVRNGCVVDLDAPAVLASLAGEQAGGGLAELPEVGRDFLGFHLLAELGRGTFGRVYLARQGELADRLVALKVSTEILAESQKLARLQHTHIVPVYSLHRGGLLQAVCMPYLGATTLADVLQDLGQRDSLPASGKGLISTLEDRKGRTDANLARPPAQAPNAPEGVPARAARAPAEVPAPLRRLEGLTYVEAVLWIGSCLADGLAHAHERGIVHRDLKPANVLLTDDGQPMLLDFNLADDLATVGQAHATHVGGTLPYMAPEHLAAFLGRVPGAVVDNRSDIYSLGVILYELLTGRHPFPRRPGAVESAVPDMIGDRQNHPPPARHFNLALTPAVDAILRRCLEPAQQRRYQSARDLREDIERHLANLPLGHTREPSPAERLQKWARRHPRLASTTTVVVAFGLLLVSLTLALATRGQRLARLEAEVGHGEFQADLRSARLLLAGRPDDREQEAEGSALARRALGRYGVLEPGDWRDRPAVVRLAPAARQQLASEAGELLLLLAGTAEPAEGLRMNEIAQACFSRDEVPRGLWRQRADLLDRLGRADEASGLRQRASKLHPSGPADRYLLARDHARQGRYREAIDQLRRVLDDDPENFAAWYLLGNCCLDGLTTAAGNPAEAVGHYTACIALRPRFASAWYNRGLAHLRLRQNAEAEADFTRALEHKPSLLAALVLRAAAREAQKKYREALADLDEALERGAPATRVLLVRSRIKLAVRDRAGSRRDRLQALKQAPTDEEGWVARGVARVADDTEGALADFAQAVKLNPRSLAGWQNRAHVLAERLGRTRDAIAALDAVLRLHPAQAPALAGRGVLWARLGERDRAHQDARAALKASSNPAILFQVAGIYALTSRQSADDRQQAVRLLARALQGGYGHSLIETDHDLAALRTDARFRGLVQAARTVRDEARER
jgi:serine/threonine protein kinase/Tfp pilus assembly protein PilF